MADLDFALPATAYEYRPLRKKLPRQKGWDVFALQSGLQELGSPALVLDGIFGRKTHKAVKKFQERSGLVVDGIAGVLTQEAIALDIADTATTFFNLPQGMLEGQIEHESSFWLGNHSPQRADGSRDCGVVQRNDAYSPHIDAFDCPLSIDALAERISKKHKEYKDLGLVTDDRAWELAAGSWNAPAWTDALAHGRTLSDSASAWIEAYIESVTRYADL